MHGPRLKWRSWRPTARLRSLLPVTIQGDAGSAAVLMRGDGTGPAIVATEVLTLGHLHRVIRLEPGPAGVGLQLCVDARMLEEDVLPIFYLHFIACCRRSRRRGLTPTSTVVYRT
jgi:hypothetical protein